jgi:hypothetical protein
MRIELGKHYGPGFQAKLKKMNDKQVQAIFFRLKEKGVLK